MLSDLADRLTYWTQRWIPSSFVIACILTLITFLAGIFLAHKSLLDCLRAWGDGFWVLLSFAMQMSLIMVTGYVVAVSPAVRSLLERAAAIPRTGNGAIASMAMTSMALAWLNWGLGLVASAMFVRALARRDIDMDYRVLVAVAYFGMGTTWHAGLSASAPLLVATPGHFMEKEIGVIPLTQTIFSPFNLTMTALVFVVMTCAAVWIHPRPEKRVRVRITYEANRSSLGARVDPAESPLPQPGENGTIAEAEGTAVASNVAFRLDQSYWVNLIIGLAGMVWLADRFWFRGHASLTIDNVNFLFLFSGILLHRSPLELLKAVEGGVQFIHGIIFQFPFYAGMYGIIQQTGLSDLVGNWFVRFSSAHTFPLIIYWYSGVINYFVPSGGSKWAIEAPYVVHATKLLQVPISRVVLSYAWGDMMTDLLQPFWCIPLLNAARLEFKDILGFEIVAFAIYALLVSLGFALLAFF